MISASFWGGGSTSVNFLRSLTRGGAAETLRVLRALARRAGDLGGVEMSFTKPFAERQGRATWNWWCLYFLAGASCQPPVRRREWVSQRRAVAG